MVSIQEGNHSMIMSYKKEKKNTLNASFKGFMRMFTDVWKVNLRGRLKGYHGSLFVALLSIFIVHHHMLLLKCRVVI